MSIQVWIISPNVGSAPPASAGLNRVISPVAHIASTTGGVVVRSCSQASASAVTSVGHRLHHRRSVAADNFR